MLDPYLNTQYLWSDFNPGVFKGSGAGTLGAFTVNCSRFCQIGKTVFVQIEVGAINITVGTISLGVILPVLPKSTAYFPAWVSSAGSQAIGRTDISAASTIVSVGTAAGSGNFAVGVNSEFSINIFYEAA